MQPVGVGPMVSPRLSADVDGINGHIDGCSSRGRPRERDQRQRPLQYVTFKSRRYRQVRSKP